jgi:hypothetical protein
VLQIGRYRKRCASKGSGSKTVRTPIVSSSRSQNSSTMARVPSDLAQIIFPVAFTANRLLRICFLTRCRPSRHGTVWNYLHPLQPNEFARLIRVLALSLPRWVRSRRGNGRVRIELGKERRGIIQYKNIPDVLRQGILSAAEENFFSPAGVDYYLTACARLLPVKLTSSKNGNTLQRQGLLSHALALVIGMAGTNIFLLKVEGMLLSLWIEGQLRERYGFKEGLKKNYSRVTPVSSTWEMAVPTSEAREDIMTAPCPLLQR